MSSHGNAWEVVEELRVRLAALGWVRDLMVAGSLATGDHVPGVSDVDLVAVVDGPVTGDRLLALTDIHHQLDHGAAAGLDLGCVYVDQDRVDDLGGRHPTWTHGRMIHRILSGVTRAELVLHGRVAHGREPSDVFPVVTVDDVRAAARAELDGYWTYAVRRPWLWLSPMISELGLTTMARARHAVATGELLTKNAAVDSVRAPRWLRAQMRERRRGHHVSPPRLLMALIAWGDACRTVGLRSLLKQR